LLLWTRRDSFFVKVLFHQCVEMTKKVTRIRIEAARKLPKQATRRAGKVSVLARAGQSPDSLQRVTNTRLQMRVSECQNYKDGQSSDHRVKRGWVGSGTKGCRHKRDVIKLARADRAAAFPVRDRQFKNFLPPLPSL
jgi:hypothetical protein